MAIRLKNQNVTNMYTPVELVTTNIAAVGYGGGGGGVTDHGYLHGLGDNDHPQYLLTANSTRLVNTSVSSLFMPKSSSSSFINISDSTEFALRTHIHGSITTASTAGVDMKFTSASNGMLIGVPAYVTAGGVNTDHTHGSNVSSTSVSGSNIKFTSASNGLTVSVPNYLTTAAQISHSHSNAVTTTTAGTVASFASASNGLTLALPAYITTAYGAAIQGSGSYTQNTGVIQFSNSNGVTFGLGTDGVMTASVPAVGGAQSGISSIIVGVNTITEGALQFSNSNGLSFGLNGSTLTGSYTVPGVTVFSNSNNVEFGLSGSTVTALANFSQSLQTSNVHNVSISTGNTSGTLAQISSGTMFLAGGNNITLSQVGNAITISGANQGGVQTGISAIDGFTSGSVIISAQANITVGSFATSDSQYVRLSVGNYITTAAASDHTHSQYQSTGAYLTTAMQSASSSVFAKTGFSTQSTSGVVPTGTLNTNGLNLGVPAWLTTAAQSGHTHSDLYQSTGTYLTTARGSTDAIGLNTAKTNTNVKWTVNSSGISLDASAVACTGVSTGSITGSVLGGTLNTAGLSLGVPAWLTVGSGGAGGAAISAGANSQNTGTVVFSNSNGFSFGLNAGTLTATGAFVNTSETGNVYFTGGSNVTWGSSTSGASTSIYLTAGGGTGGGAGNLSISAAGTNGTRDAISFSNANNISFGMSGSTITGSIPAIGTLYFSDGNNITFGSVVSGVYTTINATVAASGAADGGNIIAVPGTTAGSNATVVFSNSHGISFGLNGSTLTGSHNAYSTSSQLTATFAQTANVMLTGERSNYFYSSANTFANVSHAHSGLSFASTNGVDMAGSMNSAGLTLSVPNILTTAALSNHTHADGSIYYQDTPTVTFGISTSGLSTSVYATAVGGTGAGGGIAYGAAGNSSVSSGTVWVSNSNNVYFGISTISAGSYALTASATGLALANHTHGDVIMYFTNCAGGAVSSAGGLTLSISADANDRVGTVTGATNCSITANTSGISVNVPIGTVFFADSNGHSFSSSVGTGTASLQTTIYIVT